MKIYQIHKSGGEWEDRYDMIVGSYLKLSDAIKEKNRLREEEHNRILQAEKCDNCPFFFDYSQATETMLAAAEKYCTKYNLSETNDCSNYEFDIDESFFDVREVEVIE